MTSHDRSGRAPTQFHPCWFEGYRYVYPVVSRRSRGVSLGVNLSPTKLCNFRCVYCQVERGERPVEIASALGDLDPAQAASSDVTRRPCRAEDRLVDLDVLEEEIERLARATLDGSLFTTERFAGVEASKRVLQDFALSGDGEPTLSPQFPECVDRLAAVRGRLGFPTLRLVLITNATRLERPEIVAALDRFCAANGEIWAKLDAGDAETLKLVDRTAVPLERILQNIEFASKRWRVMIQTALFSWQGAAPSDERVQGYCQRVNEIQRAGGTVTGIQLYTVAREPVEREAEALSDDVMDARADFIRNATGLPVDVFYSR